jgi:competence protein ComEC
LSRYLPKSDFYRRLGMFRWAPYPFVRITLSFLAGILLYIYAEGEVPFVFEGTVLAGGCFLLALLLNWRRPSSDYVNLAGITAMFCFFGLGFLLTHFRTESNDPRHLLHQEGRVTFYTGRVADYLIEKPHTTITTLEVRQALIGGEWRSVTGQVRLTVSRDTSGRRLLYGDQVLVKGSPVPVRGPANPFQFDYRRYLAWRHIHHQHFVDAGQMVRLNENPESSLRTGSILVRRRVDEVLRDNISAKREYGIATALLLGVKDDLDNDIRNAYANTGTMHVLAVSGLHVGIIFGILHFFLAGLRSVPGHRFYSGVIVILVLVLYAYLTGLSPSVLRAVLMFSLFTIGTAFGFQKSTYNTLAIVAFALLCYNPYYVMEVGFQLSFLAVMAILYLQPRLYRLWNFDHKLADFVWKLITLSIAAQVATFPLGLLYFHQFPVYFLLSNLLIVPLAGVVLYAGLGFLAMSWVPLLSEMGAWVFEKLVLLMNWIIETIEWLPQSVITGVTISNAQAWLLYGAIGSVILFFQIRKLAFLALACGLMAAFSGIGIRHNRQNFRENTFVVYSIRGKSVGAFLAGAEAVLVTGKGTAIEAEEMQFHLWPHWWNSGVTAYKRAEPGKEPVGLPVSSPPAYETEEGNQIYVWRGLRIMQVQEKLRQMPAHPIPLNVLIVQNNAPIDVAVLLSGYRIQHLVFDTSNTPFYLRKMKEQIAAAGVAFHSVPEQGAFLLPVRQPASDNQGR